jgi:hypothetical protein
MPPTTHERSWSEVTDGGHTYAGDFPPGRADEKEAVTVRLVSSAGGIVTFAIRIDLNRLEGERLSEAGASTTTSRNGKEPRSGESGD